MLEFFKELFKDLKVVEEINKESHSVLIIPAVIVIASLMLGVLEWNVKASFYLIPFVVLPMKKEEMKEIQVIFEIAVYLLVTPLLLPVLYIRGRLEISPMLPIMLVPLVVVFTMIFSLSAPLVYYVLFFVFYFAKKRKSGFGEDVTNRQSENEDSKELVVR